MSTFLLKFILCSGVLYTAYHLLLRTEKILRFNRYFLLSILILSLAFPFIVTKTKYIEPALQKEVYAQSFDTFEAITPDLSIPKTNAAFEFKLSHLIWSIYALVTVFLVFRFCRNLIQIERIRKGGKLISKDGLTFCLRDDITASFTFLNTIYANCKEFESGVLPKEIIAHETVHAKQKHSIDIIFIELMQCVLWFNPILYLVKGAIKLNHEYLADKQVCAQTQEVSAYQKTLIQYVYSSKQQPVMASQLTYGQTKKRLNMMVKNLGRRNAALRICTTMVIVSFALWGFGETQLLAQDNNTDHDEQNGKLESNMPEQSKTKISIYFVSDTQKVKYLDADDNLIQKTFGDLTESEKIWFKTPEAEAQVLIAPAKANPISDDLFESLNDNKKYGIWIDNQRIKNEEISKFEPSDFHHFFMSKLYPNATNYGKHEFQINLTTHESFEKSANSKGRWRPLSGNLYEKKSKKREDNKETQRFPVYLHVPSSKNKVKYLNKEGKWIESIYGQLSASEKKRFRDPDAKGKLYYTPDEKANGEVARWIPYARRSVPNTLFQKQDSTILPKSVNLRPKSKVRFLDAGGNTVEALYGDLTEAQLKRFTRPEAKSMLFLSPPPPAQIDQEMLNKYASDEYIVKIDGELIPSKNLANYNPKDFYLFNSKLTISEDKNESKLSVIEFKTKENFNTEGEWVSILHAYKSAKDK